VLRDRAGFTDFGGDLLGRNTEFSGQGGGESVANLLSDFVGADAKEDAAILRDP
jgi:hypothetical protein